MKSIVYILLLISYVHSYKWDICDEKYENLCFSGICVTVNSTLEKIPMCLCYPGFQGSRCETSTLINYSESKILDNKNLDFVIGLIGLLPIIFTLLGVWPLGMLITLGMLIKCKNKLCLNTTKKNESRIGTRL